METPVQINEQKIIYIQGMVTVASFETACKSQGLDPRKVVFVFPGNPNHHTKKTTLYSHKSGSGVAVLTGQLGQAGYPVLSLPNSYLDPQTQEDTIQGAEQDIYRALGAGFSLMIPVRAPMLDVDKKPKYFSEKMQGDVDPSLIVLSVNQNDQVSVSNKPLNDLELSWWGASNIIPNLTLGDRYVRFMHALNQFIVSIRTKHPLSANKIEERLTQAYAQGLKDSRECSDKTWISPPKRSSKIQSSPVRIATPTANPLVIEMQDASFNGAFSTEITADALVAVLKELIETYPYELNIGGSYINNKQKLVSRSAAAIHTELSRTDIIAQTRLENVIDIIDKIKPNKGWFGLWFLGGRHPSTQRLYDNIQNAINVNCPPESRSTDDETIFL